jgi:hypothetical protein
MRRDRRGFVGEPIERDHFAPRVHSSEATTHLVVRLPAHRAGRACCLVSRTPIQHKLKSPMVSSCIAEQSLQSHAARDGCEAIEFAEATYLVASIS